MKNQSQVQSQYRKKVAIRPVPNDDDSGPLAFVFSNPAKAAEWLGRNQLEKDECLQVLLLPKQIRLIENGDIMEDSGLYSFFSSIEEAGLNVVHHRNVRPFRSKRDYLLVSPKEM